jgi:hypothetical protein
MCICRRDGHGLQNQCALFWLLGIRHLSHENIITDVEKKKRNVRGKKSKTRTVNSSLRTRAAASSASSAWSLVATVVYSDTLGTARRATSILRLHSVISILWGAQSFVEDVRRGHGIREHPRVCGGRGHER